MKSRFEVPTEGIRNLEGKLTVLLLPIWGITLTSLLLYLILVFEFGGNTEAGRLLHSGLFYVGIAFITFILAMITMIVQVSKEDLK